MDSPPTHVDHDSRKKLVPPHHAQLKLLHGIRDLNGGPELPSRIIKQDHQANHLARPATR